VPLLGGPLQAGSIPVLINHVLARRNMKREAPPVLSDRREKDTPVMTRMTLTRENAICNKSLDMQHICCIITTRERQTI
jgi:hypothetical protein